MDKSIEELLASIKDLESRLEESEQLIEAIKAGEVDAFAIKNDAEAEIFTLQTGDYAYRVLIEEIGEGAINVTEDGLIVYTNPYFLDLLKLPYDKVIGHSIFDFIHSDTKQEFERLFQESLSRKSKGEVNLTAKGKMIPAYLSLTSLQPKLSTVGIIITDFSEKKKSEKTILAYQKELETKNANLEKLNKELQSFAYISSHDLQEPLRKIQTFTSRIMEKEGKKLSEEGKYLFDRMSIAAKRMQALIDDLLAYSRSNTEEGKFEYTDLRKIVAEIKEDFEEELIQKQATINFTEMCEACVIPFQFRQLIYNLLSNSLKFTRPETPPQINITCEILTGEQIKMKNLLPEKKYCHISFSDNGIGIEAEYQDKIFELFQRLHSKDQYKGTGIGLAIVKKIVENHRGIIIVRGGVNEGATFDIYFPNE